jgi:hypothetical protein
MYVGTVACAHHDHHHHHHTSIRIYTYNFHCADHLDLRVLMGNGHYNFTIHSSYTPASRIYTQYSNVTIYIYALYYILSYTIYIYIDIYACRSVTEKNKQSIHT